MDATSDRTDEVDLADSTGARDIEDAVHAIDRPPEQRHRVIDVDPAHPLLPRPQPAADQEPHWEGEVPDELGVAREDVALAKFGDADAETVRATRFVLHGLRDLREERVAHRARLGPGRRVVAVGRLGVCVDAGHDHERLRTSVGWQSGECIDDRVDRVAPAAGDRLLPAAGPAQRSDPCPCDADHRIESVDRSGEAIDIVLRPGPDPCRRADGLRLGRWVSRQDQYLVAVVGERARQRSTDESGTTYDRNLHRMTLYGSVLLFHSKLWTKNSLQSRRRKITATIRSAAVRPRNRSASSSPMPGARWARRGASRRRSRACRPTSWRGRSRSPSARGARHPGRLTGRRALRSPTA